MPGPKEIDSGPIGLGQFNHNSHQTPNASVGAKRIGRQPAPCPGQGVAASRTHPDAAFPPSAWLERDFFDGGRAAARKQPPTDGKCAEGDEKTEEHCDTDAGDERIIGRVEHSIILGDVLWERLTRPDQGSNGMGIGIVDDPGDDLVALRGIRNARFEIAREHD